MGVAAGDVDNDGWVDIYVTNWGRNQLWRNNGDGTFSDWTEDSRAGDKGWGTSSAFLDIDSDGWLDLYVANYAEYNAATNAPCFGSSSARDYCAPTAFPSQLDRLFRNRGDGTFQDVSVPSGIASETSYGLGVVVGDFDNNTLPDLYVANDRRENFLWINQGNGTFRNEGLLSGCAVNRDGMTEASMGVDTADFDNDGDEDILLAHLDGESSTVYVNDGQGGFDDLTTSVGMAAPSIPFTTFGVGWFDYDNDGRLDLFSANGAVIIIPELAAAGDPHPLHQRNQLFRQDPDKTFREVTQEAGAAFEPSEVTRGVALGDVDNDGDPDLLLVNNNGPSRLLLNQARNAHRWIGFRLLGATESRDMLGARITLYLDDGRRIVRRARTDGSYCSSRDPRVLIGLGGHGTVERAQVAWPDGTTQDWNGLETDRYWTLRQSQADGLPDR